MQEGVEIDPLPFAHPASYNLAFLHGFDDIIDLVNFEDLRDEFIQLEIPFHGHIGEGGDIPMGINIAVQCAFNGFGVQRGECVRDAGHLPFRGDTDLDQFPTHPQRPDRLGHGTRIADDLKTEIRAAIGEFFLNDRYGILLTDDKSPPKPSFLDIISE